MTGNEALLFLIGVPAVVVALIWALAYRGGPTAEKRYRPGRPYDFAPVWYLANHGTQSGAGRPALTAGHGRAALPAAGDSSGQPAESTSAPQPVGGASERW